MKKLAGNRGAQGARRLLGGFSLLQSETQKKIRKGQRNISNAPKVRVGDVKFSDRFCIWRALKQKQPPRCGETVVHLKSCD